jgi:gliding motility-associated-like protein
LNVELEDISRAAIDRLWIIGDDEYTDSKLHYIYPSDMDTVPLSLIAYSDDGCADTLNRLLQIDRTAIFAPNTFTPSLETNSRWYIVSRDIEEMEVWIYNRQGNLVHYYSGADGYWDGTRNGKPCEQGVYVFRAEYHSRVYPDRLQSMIGTILLIR